MNSSSYYPPPVADSYAARSAQAYGNVNVGVNDGSGGGSGGMNMNMNGQDQPQPSYGQAPQQQQPQPYPPQQQPQTTMPSMPPAPPPPPQQFQQQQQQPMTNMNMPMSMPTNMNMPPQQQQQQQQQQQMYGQPQMHQQFPQQMPPPQHQQFAQPPPQPQMHPQPQQMPPPQQYNPVMANAKMNVNINDQILNDSIRRMQESTHIMHGAMEANDLATTLDRAAAMLGELGDPKHHHHHHHHHHHGGGGSGGGHNHHYHSHGGVGSKGSKEPKAVMSPKHYYELHMMALEELPNLEEFFLSFTSTPAPADPNPMAMNMGINGAYPPNHQMNMNGMNMMPPQRPQLTMTMTDLYEVVQYTPRAVPRLYLQICAGSALIRSGEVPVRDVLSELKDAVKCVQCPIRGLFLRHYLLQAVKDKLPDEKEVSDVVNVSTTVGEEHTANTSGGDDAGEKNAIPEGQEEDQKVEATSTLNTSTNTMEGVEEQMDNFQKEMDETMLKHTKALEDLMGDLGVNDHDSTTSAKDEIDENLTGSVEKVGAVNDTMKGLLGGGENTNGGGEGGLFDDPTAGPGPVPPTMPPMPPPMPTEPPAQPVAAVASASMNQEEEKQSEVDDANSTGTVKDSYKFVLSNFIEMNKLWVRIQHMPGDSKTKETRRKRERERNELRMMVGTNLVRLSELEGVTSALYGTVILPTVLDQIVACHDPLAQAYLMDCIIQVFPDEFHIQTLEVVLNVCPKLREKVNIRTILQSVMNRLANYYADELLLNDEEDTEGVKMSVMLDSFHMFDDCIKSVFDARGVKLTAREAIRLESSLLDFSLRCYPGRMDYIDQCLGMCASTLRGEGTHAYANSIAEPGTTIPLTPIEMDKAAITELEKLLSMPLEEMALNILGLEHYSELLTLLPWDNRKKVALVLLQVLDASEQKLTNIREMDQLFAIMTPLLQSNDGSGAGKTNFSADDALVAKVIHLIYHEDTDVHYEMLSCAKRRISSCGDKGAHIVPLFYEALNLLNRIKELEFPAPLPVEEPEIAVEEEVEEEMAVEEAVDADDKEKKKAEIEAGEESPVGDDEVVDSDKDGTSAESAVESGDADDNGGSASDTDAVEGQDQASDADGADSTEQLEDAEQKSDEAVSSPAATQQSPEEQPQPSKDELFGGSEDDLFGDSPDEEDDTKVEQAPELPTFTKQITCRKVFLFIQKILLSLRTSDDVEQTISCTLNAATAASSCYFAAVLGGFDGSEFSPIAYEFFTEIFNIYESSILDSSVQQKILVALIGSLLVSSRCFAESDYETLITKVTQYAARLAKKTDQCKTVMLCSHLFYSEESGYKNSKRALECLQRALKVADACVNASPSNLQLFVDIFDCYLYHFERQNPAITDRFISGLVALINEHITSAGQNPVIADSKSQFIQTVRYIEQKKNDAVYFSQFGKIVCKIPN